MQNFCRYLDVFDNQKSSGMQERGHKCENGKGRQTGIKTRRDTHKKLTFQSKTGS